MYRVVGGNANKLIIQSRGVAEEEPTANKYKHNLLPPPLNPFPKYSLAKFLHANPTRK